MTVDRKHTDCVARALVLGAKLYHISYSIKQCGWCAVMCRAL